MSDFPSRPELDDELLSAYLDDELSPEERAAVDARLADDARAREMLHQLQAVSQAVQGLPQEIVGHDLGESVLQRVSQRERTVVPRASSTMETNGRSADRAGQLEDSFPKFTIGRSPRGWFWASLAIAAALLVMFQQSDRDAVEEPRSVAMRDEQVMREELGQITSERGELEFRSLEEPASPPPSDGLAVDATGSAAPAGAVQNLEQRQSEMSPALAPAAAPPGDQRIADLGTVTDPATRSPRAGAANEVAEEFGDSATTTMSAGEPAQIRAPDADSKATVDSLAATPLNVTDNSRVEELAFAPAQEQPVIVRVLARREALESKAFDRLLESNGIEVDASTADDAALATVRAQSEPAVAEQNEAETLRAESSPQTPASGRDEEVLLVEAPASAITSSLETLSADEVNYLGIKVVDSAATATSGRFDAGAQANDSTQEQDAFLKKLQVQQDWTKYNRGTVPQTEYSLSGERLYFYDREIERIDHYGTENRFGGGYRGSNPAGLGGRPELAQQGVPEEHNSLSDRSRGRARRLQARGVEVEQQVQQLARGRYVIPEQSVAAAGPPAQPLEKLSELSSGAADRMQVLFVISPADVPASSAPARNKAQ